MPNKQKRKYEVSIGQIFLGLIIAALALTGVFELGVSVGKKRVVEAERAAQEGGRKIRTAAKTSLGEVSSAHSPSDRFQDIREEGTGSVPLGGDMPIDVPEDESEEQLQVEAKPPQFTIQVGTFSSQANSENLVNLLKSYEYNSWVRPETSTDRTLYAVYVGGFSTRTEANQFGKSLQERMSFVTGFIVRELE